MGSRAVAGRPHTEQWKKIRATLDLIHDDKAVQPAENQRRFFEAGQVCRILKIEWVVGPFDQSSATCFASVVLPTCRAPRMATTR